MSVRIGANPIGWSNDDLQEIGGDTSLETCLKEAHEVGFAGMELGHKFPRQPQALLDVLKPNGMSVIGNWYSCELLTRSATAEIEAMQTHLALMKAVGVKVFIIAETSNAIHGARDIPLSRTRRLQSHEWAAYGQKMTQVADAVRAAGLQLVYHHHMGTIIYSREDIENFMANTGPSVHLLLDTGHATWGGCDPAELARTYRNRISHVHCKDVRAHIRAKSQAGDWSFLDSVLGQGDELGIYTVPGDGMVDFASVFAELKGYDGWVVVEAEQDPKKAPALAYAKKGMAHLRAVLQPAGLLN
ncbi:MAG: myo-inosose-2 dehydratase [Hyphomicrobiales bacterium]|nr:myo-inosose-2 dehydratase [Hyphomicrobiales bacterium]MDE2115104.1 myo-inosose-2 dehydratase [Hyphomicrobiales bacterium]